jgi:hypothetical protein
MRLQQGQFEGAETELGGKQALHVVLSWCCILVVGGVDVVLQGVGVGVGHVMLWFVPGPPCSAAACRCTSNSVRIWFPLTRRVVYSGTMACRR